MRRLLCLAVAVCLSLFSGVASPALADVVPQRKWLQVRSPNFTVMGEAGGRELRQVAERLEQLHELLAILTERQDAPVPDTVVLVFRDRGGYRPFQPRFQGKPVDVAGYFMPGLVNYVTILTGPTIDHRDTVYHEYVHLATASMIGALPLWISEGLAEFYSTFEPADGGRAAYVGQPIQQHIRQVQKQRLPLATLAAIDHASPYYNERDKTSVFYAQSWAFLHFLQVGQNRKYASRVGPFLAAVAGGMPFEAAASTHLGVTPAVLERELDAHVRAPVLMRLKQPLPERLSRIERLEPTPVAEADVHARLGHLLERFDRDDEAREQLNHALSVNPRHALALALRAQMAADAGKADEARDLARRAGESPDASYLAHYLRGAALDAADGVSGSLASEVEAALRRAVALNPGFAEGHAHLAWLLATTPAGLDEAVQLQARAIELAPARESYALDMASILIRRGDTPLARQRLGLLLSRGNPETKKAARALLARAATVELAARERAGAATGDTMELERSAPDPAPAASPGPAVDTPILRSLNPGEQRIAGRLAAIECAADGALLMVETVSGAVRVHAADLATVEFITYRQDLSGTIGCGPQRPTHDVLVTFVPVTGASHVGSVIAVEFPPPGFVVPPPADPLSR